MAMTQSAWSQAPWSRGTAESSRRLVQALDFLYRTLDPKARRAFKQVFAQQALDPDVEAYVKALRAGSYPVLSETQIADLASKPGGIGLTDAQLLYIEAFTRAGDLTRQFTKAQGKPLSMSFSVHNERASEYVREHGLVLSRNVKQSVWEGIRHVTDQALLDGEHPSTAAKRILKEGLGLDQRYARAVQAYRRRLVQQGVPPQRATELAGKYRDRLLAQRATTIARTELLEAVNAGQHESWAQAIDAGILDPSRVVREWITHKDERTCPTCGALDGQQVGFTDPFSDKQGTPWRPPRHPSCRCTTALVPIEDATYRP